VDAFEETMKAKRSPRSIHFAVGIAIALASACQLITGVSDLVVVAASQDASAANGGRGNGGNGPGGSDASGSGGQVDAGGNAGRDGGATSSGGAEGSGGSSGSGGAVTDGGGGTPCTDKNDCPGVDDECRARVCTAGRCALQFTAAGTPTSTQRQGDCKQNECDDAGNIIEAALSLDVEDDNNDCTVDSCNGSAPAHTFATLNTPCGAGGQTKCNATGQCVGCTARADCPADDACTTWSCNTSTGVCGSQHANPGTPCGDTASCAGGIGTLADGCTNAGGCQDEGTVSCGLFNCGATACHASCTTDAECVAGAYCDTGVCVGKKGLSEGCSVKAECSSNECVDGVCCENACAGLCMTCNGKDTQGSPSPGLCTPVDTNTDPKDECAQGRACDGNGACTGHQECDCSTSAYSATAQCCNACDQADCPPAVNDCTANDDKPCTNIGGVAEYSSGDSIDDQSGQCSPARRCAVLACTCVQ
jgi:hypothetical protein